MSDIYLIYKPLQEPHGYIEEIGSYMGYCAGKISEIYIDNRIELGKINATVVDKDVALGCLFADSYHGRVSVKGGTPQAKQLEPIIGSLPMGEKFKYQLNEEDNRKAILFNKAVLYKIVEDRFNQKFKELQLQASDLEKASWQAQETEALLLQASADYSPTPILDALAEIRGITTKEMSKIVLQAIEKHNLKVKDLLVQEQKIKQEIKECKTLADYHWLRHLKFGVSLNAQHALDKGIEKSPATLKITF